MISFYANHVFKIRNGQIKSFSPKFLTKIYLLHQLYLGLFFKILLIYNKSNIYTDYKLGWEELFTIFFYPFH